MTTQEFITNRQNNGVFYTDVPGPIMNQYKYSSVDYWYGPYNSLDDAYDVIPEALRDVGLTVGILNENEEVSEYWFQYDTNNPGTLVLKSKGIHTKLDSITISNPVTDDQEHTVRFNYSVNGSSLFPANALSVYQKYQNTTSRVKIQDFNVDGGEIVIYNVKEGAYQYYIEVTDIFGHKISSNIIPVTIGKVKITINLLQIPTLTLINRTNLLARSYSFTYFIEILDPTWQSVNFYLYADEDNETRKVFSNKLTTGSLQTVQINESFFSNISGGKIYIEGQKSEEAISKDLFTILSDNTINVERTDSQSTFYYDSINDVGKTKSVQFIFSSGALSSSIEYDTEQSDFSFPRHGDISFGNDGKAYITLKLTTLRITDKAKIVFKYSIGSNSPKLISCYMGRIIESPVSTHVDNWEEIPNNTSTLSPFYLDFSGSISPTDNENTKILQLHKDIYIDNNIIKVGNLKVATPLNQKVYIGIGYKLTDTNQNTLKQITYNCICINGMVVKTVIVDNAHSNNEIGGTWAFQESSGNIMYGETNNQQKLRHIYISGSDSGYFNGGLVTTNGDLLCEANYYADAAIFDIETHESENLPQLFLIAKQVTNEELALYENLWDPEEPLNQTRFGTILEGQTQKHDNLAAFQQDSALLKMHTNIKGDAQKYYGVVCNYYYDAEGNTSIDSFNDNYANKTLIAYTQGTSTLKYAIPNFKFFFQDKSGDDYTGIPLVVDDKIYYESMLTAKADYMESSHLNNTPTAMLYNKIVNDLSIIPIEYRSPAIAANNNPNNINSKSYSDAIVGTPIRLYIKDIGSSSFENYGSFMLNTDKVSDSLGFKLNDTLSENNVNYEPTCISFEGTSNSHAGSAARFIANENDMTAGDDDQDSTVVGYMDISNIALSFNQLNDGQHASQINQIKQYLSRGFEYRYPDRKIYQVKNGKTKYMQAGDFEQFYKMWEFVCHYDTYETQLENAQEIEDPVEREAAIAAIPTFEKVFNLPYCYLYIIFLMVFGQTDNLGKNCMFDCWKTDGEWGKWFPRPYDLDSQCGLNNGGAEVIPPFVMVSSLWLPTTKVDDQDVPIPIDDSQRFNYKYIDARTLYGYASSTSRLWSTIYVKYKAEIEAMYKLLRGDGEENSSYDYLNYEKLMNHYKNCIIDKIPASQYNIDFLNKYLGSPQHQYMMGNRWTNFQDWMRARLAFCDSFFNYKKVTIDFLDGITLNVKQMFPAFVFSVYEQDGRTLAGFGTNVSLDVGGTGNIATTLTLSDSIITYLNLYEENVFSSGLVHSYEFTNLRTLKVDGTNAPDLSKCLVLEELEIGPNAYYSSITVPASVKRLVVNKSCNIIFEKDNFLEECTIQNNTTESIDFGRCKKLTKLILKNNNIGNLTLSENKLSNFVSQNNTFQDVSISDCEISRLDLSLQTISSLNISGKIDQIDLYGCEFTNTVLDFTGLKFPENASDIKGNEISNFTLNLIKSNITVVKIPDTFKNLTNLRLGVQESEILSMRNYSGSGSNNDNYIDLTQFPDSTKITSIAYITNTLFSTGEPINTITSISYDNTNDKYETTNDAGSKVSLESSRQNLRNSNTSPNRLCLGRTKITKVKLPTGTLYGTALFAKCKNLQTLVTSGECNISSLFVFYNCAKLASLPSNLKISRFRGAFIGSKIPYNGNGQTIIGIEDVIDKNAYDVTDTVNNGSETITVTSADFGYFYYFGRPEGNNPTITVNANKYPIIANLSGTFGNIYDSGRFFYKDPDYFEIVNNSQVNYDNKDIYQRKRFNVTIIGNFEFTPVAFNLLETFQGCKEVSFKDGSGNTQNTFLTNEQKQLISQCTRTFRECTIKFNILNFLNGMSEITSTQGMFSYATIVVSGSEYDDFKLPYSKLYYNGTTSAGLSGMFQSAKFVNSDETIRHPIKIDGIITNIHPLEGTASLSVESCFYHCLEAYIESTLTIPDSIDQLNFAGFLGAENNTISVETAIFVSNKIVMRRDGVFISTGSWANTNDRYLTYQGPFKNRKIISVSQISLIGNNIQHYCEGIYPPNTLQIEISGSNNIQSICKNARNIKVTVSGLSTNCIATNAFYGTQFIASQFNGISDTTSNSNFDLTNIINADSMFQESNLKYIDFVLPDTLTSCKNMFRECKFLRGGLPSAFFVATSVQDISYMFFLTQIVASDNTFSELRDIIIPSSVTNLEGTFARTRHKGSNDYLNVTLTSQRLSNLVGSFASSQIPINNIIINTLSNATDASYAFVDYCSATLSSWGSWSTVGSKVSNAQGMFACTSLQNVTPPAIPENIAESTGMFHNWNTTSSAFSIPEKWVFKSADWNDVSNE